MCRRTAQEITARVERWRTNGWVDPDKELLMHDTREQGNGPYDLTGLQQLAAAAREIVRIWDDSHDPGDEMTVAVNQLSNVYLPHTDDPDWFPVKFERGDWVKADTDAVGFVKEVNERSVCITTVSPNSHEWLIKDCVLATDRDIGEYVRMYTNDRLGEFIRDNFKP